MLERIRILQQLACPLEPEAGARMNAVPAVIGYAENYLQGLPQAPAYYLSDADGSALDASPIARGDRNLRALLELLKNHVDS